MKPAQIFLGSILLLFFIINNGLAAPIASFSYENSCEGDTVKFTNKSTGFSNLHWSFGDGEETWSFEKPIHIYDKPGIYTVILTAYATDGSSNTFQKIIQIFSLPAIKLDYLGDTIFYKGNSVELKVEGSFASYIWTKNGVQISTENKLRITERGNYVVSVIDNNECKNSISTQITVKDSVTPSEKIEVLNNVLTPNFDNVNDRLMIKDIEYFSSPCKVLIYNVWGTLIYTNDVYVNETGFDGSANGKELVGGTYYYLISSEGREGLAGYIDILR